MQMGYPYIPLQVDQRRQKITKDYTIILLSLLCWIKQHLFNQKYKSKSQAGITVETYYKAVQKLGIALTIAD